jgi:hypothetical protein
MLYLIRGSDLNQPYSAYNSNGGILDISSATIVFNLKESSIATSEIFQKLNTLAGGDDTQIKTITENLFRVHLLNSDTVNLIEEDYYYEIVIDDQVNQYGILRLQPATGISSTTFRTSGTTAQRPVLPAGQFVGYNYFDTDLLDEIHWDGSAWAIPASGTQQAVNTADITELQDKSLLSEDLTP